MHEPARVDRVSGPLSLTTAGGTATTGNAFTVVTYTSIAITPDPSGDRVMFAGTLATIGSATPTSIAVTVPNGALATW